jgi:ABC-type nitrate/sulfonate/bicarbonate transport system substrate-binding protein
VATESRQSTERLEQNELLERLEQLELFGLTCYGGEMRLFSTIKTLISLALFFAFACSPNRTQAADAPLVRANYAAFSGAFAPLWIAADRNLFAKYGLNVDIRYIAPATATQALIGKNLEIINPGGEIVEAGLNSEPVVYFAGILNRAVMSIYAKPEIASLADLKGKVLAVTVPGATTDFAARVLLQQARLTPGKDVKLIYLKGMVEILTGINQGNADAGIFTSPTTLESTARWLERIGQRHRAEYPDDSCRAGEHQGIRQDTTR